MRRRGFTARRVGTAVVGRHPTVYRRRVPARSSLGSDATVVLCYFLLFVGMLSTLASRTFQTATAAAGGNGRRYRFNAILRVPGRTFSSTRTAHAIAVGGPHILLGVFRKPSCNFLSKNIRRYVDGSYAI